MFKVNQTVKVAKIANGGMEHLNELIGKRGVITSIDNDTPNGEIGYNVEFEGLGEMLVYESELSES